MALVFYELETVQWKKACKNVGTTSIHFWTIVTLVTSQLLLVVNSSVNKVIYCCLGTKFRQEVFKSAKELSSATKKIVKCK